MTMTRVVTSKGCEDSEDIRCQTLIVVLEDVEELRLLTPVLLPI